VPANSWPAPQTRRERRAAHAGGFASARAPVDWLLLPSAPAPRPRTVTSNTARRVADPCLRGTVSHVGSSHRPTSPLGTAGSTSRGHRSGRATDSLSASAGGPTDGPAPNDAYPSPARACPLSPHPLTENPFIGALPGGQPALRHRSQEEARYDRCR
jgi:hypothetical protein